jgi:hypothetical protein
MRFAPVLDDVAGRLAGRPPGSRREDPVGWAYALRDAVAVADPDVVVSHLDPTVERDALAPLLAGGEDPVDAVLDAPPLGGLGPALAAVELVRTLTGALPRPVAATLTGPATLAAALAADAGDPEELAEVCGDALAGYAALLAEAGATTIVVVETAGGFAGAHAPIVRALALHAVEAVLWTADPAGEDAGYPALARGWSGEAPAPPVAVVGADPSCWPGPDAARDVDLLLTDGPVPADADLDALRRQRLALARVV